MTEFDIIDGRKEAVKYGGEELGLQIGDVICEMIGTGQDAKAKCLCVRFALASSPGSRNWRHFFFFDFYRRYSIAHVEGRK